MPREFAEIRMTGHFSRIVPPRSQTRSAKAVASRPRPPSICQAPLACSRYGMTDMTAGARRGSEPA